MEEEEITEEKVQQVVGLGFSREKATEALKVNRKDVNQAIDWLLNRGPPWEWNETNEAWMEVKNDETEVHMDEEKAFEKALNVSREESEKNELEKAIQASIQTSTKTADHYLSKAIEQSLALQFEQLNEEDLTHPRDQLKSNDLPAGLRNIGNTCYVNSVLQTYFHLPIFRNHVLSHDLDEENLERIIHKLLDDPSSKDSIYKVMAIRFVYELQRLFALMLKSRKRYHDPTPAVKALLAASDHSITIGNQADISEFNQLFLQVYDSALTILRTTEPSTLQVSIPNGCDIKSLFHGELRSEGIGEEPDGLEFGMARNEAFSQIILNVENHENLYESLDAYTEKTIIENCVTPSGFRTNLTKETWFDRLPAVLTIQLQRVKYNPDIGRGIKIHDYFLFDSLIYMDRYTYNHKNETKQNRMLYYPIRELLKEKENLLRRYKLELQKNTQSLSDFLENIQDDANESSDKHHQASIPMQLELCIDLLKKKIADTEQETGLLRKNLLDIFNQVSLQKNCYKLHAILVHEGEAGEGHYWAFIFDRIRNAWIKFNDVSTTLVTEETVWNDSLGGLSKVSAYCLIYLDDHSCSSYDMKPTIWSEALQIYAKEDDAKFQRQLDKYKPQSKVNALSSEERNLSSEIENTTNQVKMEHDQIVDEFMNLAEPNIDVRLKSFELFLCSLARFDLLHHYLILNRIRKIDDFNILPPRINELFKLDPANDITILCYQKDYQQFQQIAEYYLSGLEALIKDQNYLKALEFLFYAYILDRTLPLTQAKRDKDLIHHLCTALAALSDHAKKKIQDSSYRSRGLDLAQKISSIISYLLADHCSSEDTLRDLRNEWINLIELLKKDSTLSQEHQIDLQNIRLGLTKNTSKIPHVCAPSLHSYFNTLYERFTQFHKDHYIAQ